MLVWKLYNVLQNTPTAPVQRSKTPNNECPRYVIKQSDGEIPVMVKLWKMGNTPLLPSLPGPLWPGVRAPDRVISIGQIELNCVLMLNWIVWCRTLLEKQGRDRKWCAPVDPRIWPIKSRTTSSNIHTAAMWWYGM